MPRPHSRRQIEARIESLVKKWAEWMGLSQQWYIHVEFVYQLPNGGATTNWQTNYKDATIKFGRKHFEDHYDEAEKFVIHELLHLVLAPICDTLLHHIGGQGAVYKDYNNAEENVVDTLARLFHRAEGAGPYTRSATKEGASSEESQTKPARRGTSTAKIPRVRSAKRSTARASSKSRSRGRRS